MSDQRSKTSPFAPGAAEAMENVSAALTGAKEYNTKFMEFAQANTQAAFAFAQKLWGVKSPTDFVELSVEHSRTQIETMTKQTKELAELAQKVTLQSKK